MQKGDRVTSERNDGGHKHNMCIPSSQP